MLPGRPSVVAAAGSTWSLHAPELSVPSSLCAHSSFYLQLSIANLRHEKMGGGGGNVRSIGKLGEIFGVIG